MTLNQQNNDDEDIQFFHDEVIFACYEFVL